MARPSRYKAEFAEQAEKLCRLGATDKEMADFFGVTEKTINNWKKAHPQFLQALKAGKQLADAEVADKLFQRAIGYSHPDVHVSNYQGEITITPLTKHYPPDPTSMIFWLKNRRPDLWRDKPEPTDEDGNATPVKVEISVKDARIRDDDQPDTEPASS
ncbi:terminase [Parapusillimonas sp. JC17]|uniref:terminase n=1 Tax=Parapusillimonas sp. JC17 TaxID=3445768 RepID=UPI003FA0BEC9